MSAQNSDKRITIGRWKRNEKVSHNENKLKSKK